MADYIVLYYIYYFYELNLLALYLIHVLYGL